MRVMEMMEEAQARLVEKRLGTLPLEGLNRGEPEVTGA